MEPLITMEQARSALRVLSADLDEDIDFKVRMAGDIVMGYIKKDAEALGWTHETAPYRIRAAVTLVLKALFFEEDEPLSVAVKNLLHRDRDPALA